MDSNMLICCRISFGGYVVPGSIPGSCCRCGEPVWIAPSSLLILNDNPGTQILCIECGLKAVAAEPGPIHKITPAQFSEVEEFLEKKDGVG